MTFSEPDGLNVRFGRPLCVTEVWRRRWRPGRSSGPSAAVEAPRKPIVMPLLMFAALIATEAAEAAGRGVQEERLGGDQARRRSTLKLKLKFKLVVASNVGDGIEVDAEPVGLGARGSAAARPRCPWPGSRARTSPGCCR